MQRVSGQWPYVKQERVEDSSAAQTEGGDWIVDMNDVIVIEPDEEVRGFGLLSSLCKNIYIHNGTSGCGMLWILLWAKFQNVCTDCSVGFVF